MPVRPHNGGMRYRMSAVRRQFHRVRPGPPVHAARARTDPREFTVRWNAARPLDEAIGLKRRATGPTQGRVKVPVVVHSMLERGFVRITDDGGAFPAANFTEASWRALRMMATDLRQLDP